MLEAQKTVVFALTLLYLQKSVENNDKNNSSLESGSYLTEIN